MKLQLILNILASISIVTVYLLLNVIIIKPDKSISFNTQDLNVKDGFLRIYRLFNIWWKSMKKYVLFDKKNRNSWKIFTKIQLKMVLLK